MEARCGALAVNWSSCGRREAKGEGRERVGSERFTADEAAILRPYVTNTDRPIFALRHLPEEVVAVLFAYYSRSRDSLRRNLLKLLQDNDLDLDRQFLRAERADDELATARQKAREFHEKWVVGYGHASVAEHAVAHLAIEDASIVVSKLIEDARLASFTEKSTRYVLFDRDKFYREPRLMESTHARLYAGTCAGLLTAYADLTDPVLAAVMRETPRGPKQGERAHEAACRAKVFDVLRYLVPAATLTNIGMTINGRALESLIAKLLSHPLAEARETGAAIKAEAQQIIPTLIKYAEANPYQAETRRAMEAVAEAVAPAVAGAEGSLVSLVRCPADAETQLVASVLYGYTAHPWTQVMARAQGLSADEKARILDEYLKRRGPHDQPLRALEHLSYTFDILVDFGAYRDIQRHRMVTQTPQESTALHGYSTPPEVERYGIGATYREWMDRAARAHQTIAAEFPREAQYLLPLAFRKRVLFTWNLRELYHFVELRSGKQGHASYRQIAQQIFRELERIQPLLARYIRVDLEDHPIARG
jgi:thymidylate synthase ThyX